MTRVLALAGQSKIGLSRSGGSPKPGPKPIRNGVPLWTETACRFPPKPPAGLNRNRLSETPKFARLDQLLQSLLQVGTDPGSASYRCFPDLLARAKVRVQR